MKSTRKMLALALALVLCLALFPASASAAGIESSGQAGPTAEFVLYTDGRLVISGTGVINPMNQWSFSSFANDYVSSADAVVQTRSEVRTLVIEEGITQIGAVAFDECPRLTSVDLPLSLTSIQASAFQDCSSLVSIVIPSNVRSIGASAFMNCTGLTGVYLSDGLQTIGSQAFMNCTALPEVTIPANVTQIGSQCFANCGSLKTVTFIGNYQTNLIGNNAFQNVKATVYYPVDNDSWNNNAANAFQDFGGRLEWKASAEYSESDGWVRKGTAENPVWYYYQNGVMVRENWVAYNGFWFYFGANGRMLTGRQLIDGKYYYLDPNTGVRRSGLQADGNFYDDNGVWQPAYSGVDDTGLNMFNNGWQRSNDGKWFYIKDKAKVKGWLKWKDYWYYLDPTTGAMVTGWLTVDGKTYYLRPADVAAADNVPEGAMIAGRTERIGDAATGQYYTFDASGVMVGGRVDQNPLGNLTNTGWRRDVDSNGNAGGSWYFYRSDGSMVKSGWELISNGTNNGDKWYYFNDNGSMKTGWLSWNGNWYYLTPANGTGDPRTSTTGQMVTGFVPINSAPGGAALPAAKTYFFKSNGALNGQGWINDKGKWFYLAQDGTLVLGWFKDGANWYYLDDGTSPKPNGTGNYRRGEMVTGVFNVPETYDGGIPNAWFGTHSFAANGVWLSAGTNGGATVAGGWNGNRYLDTDGVAQIGWQWIDAKWYYLNPNSNPVGQKMTGWINDGNNWYYLDGNGVMQTGWLSLNGTWYYLNTVAGSRGARMTGWQYIGNCWYYFDTTNGIMQVGWLEEPAGSGTMYYLRETTDNTRGQMVTGTQTIGGVTYIFAADGHLIGKA